MKTLIAISILVWSMATQAESKKDIIRQISATAEVAGIDPDVAVAIATVESGLNPQAVGGLGELGLFQLRPEYHHTIVGDSKHNTLIGVAYLLELQTKFAGRYGNAWFVLFNYGPHKAPKVPRETAYYKKVMSEVGKLKFKRYVAVR